MDVFVIHSGGDRELILSKLKEIKKEVHGFNPLMLMYKEAQKKEPAPQKESDNGQKKKKRKFEIPFWKIDAARKIKKAQMILFFVGKASHTSENIDWEIIKAIKLSKPIRTVKLEDSNKLNESLLVTDPFSGEKNPYNTESNFDELVTAIKEHENGHYRVFNSDIQAIDKNILLEQYKVFLQTSEDLVSRRQNVNNFYISINSALMAAFGIIWALEILPIYKFFTGILLSAVGIILSISWIKLLASYGDLNSSKMKIISYIEKQLPASLFDAEWAALSDKLNKRKYVSFTNSEKRVPILFVIVYICVSICGIAFLF